MEILFLPILHKNNFMAEIQSLNRSNHKKGNRLVKKSTRVDLTPMVDLGFLLITFFVFTTTMAKPMAMDIVVPNDNDSTNNNPVCASCALTAILTADNKIKYYEGDLANAVIHETDYSPKGIRNILIKKKEKVKHVRGNGEEFVLIIKPTKESTFKNFVDITDEVTINDIKKYFVDEVRPIEMGYLK